MLLPHRAIIATTLSLAVFLDAAGVHLAEKDSLLSFLPLAHVFDRHSARMRGGCRILPMLLPLLLLALPLLALPLLALPLLALPLLQPLLPLLLHPCMPAAACVHRWAC